jgi:hypothetical protein
MKVSCVHCKAVLNAPDDRVGKKCKCPNCKQSFVLHLVAEPAPDVDLVPDVELVDVELVPDVEAVPAWHDFEELPLPPLGPIIERPKSVKKKKADQFGEFLGTLMVIAGFGYELYYFSMSTTVGTVHNIGLLNEKQNGIIASVGIAIIGLLFIGIALIAKIRKE